VFSFSVFGHAGTIHTPFQEQTCEMCPELIIVRKQNEVIKRVEASGLGQIVSLRCVHLITSFCTKNDDPVVTGVKVMLNFRTEKRNCAK
jgi:hypothetical protein